MKAGSLRHRVKIQQPVETVDSTGTTQVKWVDVAETWASIEPLEGREFFAAKQINPEVQGRIRIRYRDEITPKDRVVYNGREFDILAILNREERNIELELLVNEPI
jgi:SPP1 family predicted phage head-tail adaptor